MHGGKVIGVENSEVDHTVSLLNMAGSQKGDSVAAI